MAIALEIPLKGDKDMRPERIAFMRLPELALRSAEFALFAALGAWGMCESSNAGVTIMSFDVPGSTETAANSINGKGSITGLYFDGSGAVHGFVRAADGTITTFDAPGFGTSPQGINNKRSITGRYEDSSNVEHGFVRAADGTTTTFDPSGSTATVPVSINRKGSIVGSYRDSGNVGHGFVRAADGTITTFDAPGSIATGARSINDHGAIAGSYADSGNIIHGFVRASDGTITTFDPPGSIQTGSAGINNTVTIAIRFCHRPATAFNPARAIFPRDVRVSGSTAQTYQHQSQRLDRRRLCGQQPRPTRLCAGCRWHDHVIRPFRIHCNDTAEYQWQGLDCGNLFGRQQRRTWLCSNAINTAPWGKGRAFSLPGGSVVRIRCRRESRNYCVPTPLLREIATTRQFQSLLVRLRRHTGRHSATSSDESRGRKGYHSNCASASVRSRAQELTASGRPTPDACLQPKMHLRSIAPCRAVPLRKHL